MLNCSRNREETWRRLRPSLRGLETAGADWTAVVKAGFHPLVRGVAPGQCGSNYGCDNMISSPPPEPLAGFPLWYLETSARSLVSVTILYSFTCDDALEASGKSYFCHAGRRAKLGSATERINFCNSSSSDIICMHELRSCCCVMNACGNIQAFAGKKVG